MKAEGGEALTVIGAESASGGWHVLWTRSNCEQLVYDHLGAKGLNVFLPTVESWCRRGGVRWRARFPLFKGYLFLHHAMDKSTYLEICKTRGLVRVIGERWDRLAVVSESEIEAIQRIISANLPVLRHPYLREGERVRITHGPLTGVEGILLRGNTKKGILVVSVELLRRSVAVHLDCTILEAA